MNKKHSVFVCTLQEMPIPQNLSRPADSCLSVANIPRGGCIGYIGLMPDGIIGYACGPHCYARGTELDVCCNPFTRGMVTVSIGGTRFASKNKNLSNTSGVTLRFPADFERVPGDFASLFPTAFDKLAVELVAKHIQRDQNKKKASNIRPGAKPRIVAGGRKKTSKQ